jgi:hypothetical protein
LGSLSEVQKSTITFVSGAAAVEGIGCGVAVAAGGEVGVAGNVAGAEASPPHAASREIIAPNSALYNHRFIDSSSPHSAMSRSAPRCVGVIIAGGGDPPESLNAVEVNWNGA